ncbi:MAG: stage 0 sporulation protein [bacterium]|nr:stage 0 sporulation protein [bacterium]
MNEDETTSPKAILVVGVRFRPAGQIYDFDPGLLHLEVDDRILVETERGVSLATVAVPPRLRPTGRALQRVVKKADGRDLAREDRALQRERDLRATALALFKSRRLPLKLVKVESTLDGGRVTVFFAADEKQEVRDLARDLAQTLHTRVELRQIGSRDEAKMVGGLGVCGRELCCSSWLREFAPVSVKMVKAQGLSLNPSKLAGQCGRLKCCMRYEYDTYQELRRSLPAMGAQVESVKGNGQVVAQNLLKQTVVLRLADGERVEAGLEDLVARRGSDG